MTPETDRPTDFALSPDGRQLVFGARGDGVSRLWLRSLATTTAQRLPGTEGGTYPFWSPDGRSIGFFATGALKRLDLGGGASRVLAPVTLGSGGSWNTEGVILFAPNNATTRAPLMRVNAAGGPSIPATTLGSQQSGHSRPFCLPDGRRFLLRCRRSTRGGGALMAVSVGGAGDVLEAESPTMLFSTRNVGGGVDSQQGRNYDIASDGPYQLGVARPPSADHADPELGTAREKVDKVGRAGTVRKFRTVRWGWRGN